MVPEGIFRGNVKAWGLGKATTGTYQFQLQVAVKEKAKDPDDLSAGYEPLDKPMTKTVFMAITQGTKPFVLADLQFIGYDGKTLASARLIPGSPASFDFKDKTVALQCVHDEWNGKIREKWKICRRKTASAMAREDISQFDALFASDEAADDVDTDNLPI